MKNIFYLFVLLLFSCNSSDDKTNETSTKEFDSTLVKSRDNLIQSYRIQRLSDSITQKEVIRIVTKIQYLTNTVEKLKIERVELLKNQIVERLIYKTDTVYIEKRKNFWGKEKTKVETKKDSVIEEKLDTTYIELPDTNTISFQPYFDCGYYLGASKYLGDLDNNTSKRNFMGGYYFTYYPKYWLGIRLAGNYGKLEANDYYSVDENLSRRNLNFRTNIYEAYLATEVYPLSILNHNKKNFFFDKFRPYGLIGIGVYNFNPQGYDILTNQWVNLKPLRTEGQGFLEYSDRKIYNTTQLNIPLGVGVRYDYNDKFYFGFEFLYRKLFTDYLDDVSTTYINPEYFYNYLPYEQAYLAQRMSNKSYDYIYGINDIRGNSKRNDSYYTISTRIGFKF